jgi:hypothetical protein
MSSTTTTSEESSTSSPADIIKGWETDRLIKFLRNDKNFKDLGLNDGFFTKLEDEKITGQSFLMLTGWKFKEYGMTLRQALELEDYIKELG